ncbi:MAG: apolipoprotein N-acyltransferase [Clostridia bacterium]|nr:apolipoprotein N-acyltransferase [Clostridia bacterium]
MLERKRFRLPLLFLLGALAALPVSFFQLSALSFAVMIPSLFLFFGTWRRADQKRSFFREYGEGFCFLMGFFMLTFHWFVYLWPLDFVGGMTRAGAFGVILAACVGLPLLQSAGFAFLFPILARLSRTRTVRRFPILLPFLFAAGWVLFAYTQTLTWAGVPWGAQLALSQQQNLLILSSASLFGSYFVTFVIAAVNGLAALALLSLLEGDGRLSKIAAISSALVFVLNFALSASVCYLPREEGEEIRVAVLQGNFSSSEKWGGTTELLDTYASLAREAAAEGAELVVWPETAIPYSLRGDGYTLSFIKRLAEETNATHIVGAFCYETDEESGERLRRNSLYLFRPDGSVAEEIYHKRHLVPFGEYVPMESVIRTLLPFLAELEMLDDGSSLYAGESSTLFYEDLGVIGGLVCFDSIYPALARDSVRDGANLLVLGTNDSWFFDSAAVYQHNGQAILRAVETGRAIARSANTGVSSIISSRGEVLAEIEPLIAGQATATVNLSSQKTLYTVIGDTFVLLCQIFFLLPFVISLIEWIRQKKPK